MPSPPSSPSPASPDDAQRRLVFVYNADSGLRNAVRDVVHRVARPSTYPCSLCQVTYGAAGMDRSWRSYTAGLGMPVEFWHRDELRRERPDLAALELPAAVLLDEDAARLVVPAEQMRSAGSVPELVALVDAGLGRSAR